MILTGKLTNPVIRKYYVTGSVQAKERNTGLQKMLQKIKAGGINEFLNDEELKSFARGMVQSFKDDNLLNANNTLTAEGEDIAKTGRAWKTLSGAFIVTVFHYGRENFLLDCQAVRGKKDGNGKEREYDFESTEHLAFSQEDYRTNITEFRALDFDSNFALQGASSPAGMIVAPAVKFRYDYQTQKCAVTVQLMEGSEEWKIETDENSSFQIINSARAWNAIRGIESTECFTADENNPDALTVHAADEEHYALIDKYFNEFCSEGCFTYNASDKNIECKVSGIHAIIDDGDKATLDFLLDKFLMRRAREAYLGYEETGRLAANFLRLFDSAPNIEGSGQDIYSRLVQKAEEVKEDDPVPYLHLKAYIDLNPSGTIKPYRVEAKVKDLSGASISMEDVVQSVFGDERRITAVKTMSKYTAENPWNARNFLLFAECVHKKYSTKLTLITSGTQNKNPQYKEENEKWAERIKSSKYIDLVLKDARVLQEIHDRYFKAELENGEGQWWKLSAELDKLEYDGDRPRIREDITSGTQGTATEMTWMPIAQKGVPEAIVQMMSATTESTTKGGVR